MPIFLPHEGADMAPADLAAPVPEGIPDAPRAEIGLVQVDPVDQVHELSVSVAYQNRNVVDARPGEVEDLALLCQRQRMLPVDHFFALDPSMRPSAIDKKSFSIANWPIFA